MERNTVFFFLVVIKDIQASAASVKTQTLTYAFGSATAHG